MKAPPETRNAYYTLSDGVEYLKDANRKIQKKERDPELTYILKATEKCLKVLRSHLDANYIWD